LLLKAMFINGKARLFADSINSAFEGMPECLRLS
jgi:hypothetical protein